MKHISIGKVNQIQEDLYGVSFFNDNIKKEVSRKGMLGLIQKHSKGFLDTLEASSLCIEYYPKEGSKHYIVVDSKGSFTECEKSNEPIVYEETEYEYRSSHKLFYKNDSTRNIINERDYNFYDVVKSSASWKKRISKLLVLTSLLVILSSLFFGAFFVNLSSKEIRTNIMENKEDISLTLSITFSFCSSFSFLMTYVHLKRIILKNDSQRYLVKWRRWYKSRLWSIILAALFAFFALSFNAWFHYLLENNYYQIDSSSESLYINNKIISITNITFLSIFLLMTTGILILANYRKRFFLKKLFSKEEKYQFSKWLKYKASNVQKNQNHNFLFDSNVSEVSVTRELETSEKLIAELSPEDLKRYKRKIIKHFSNAFNSYILLLKDSAK